LNKNCNFIQAELFFLIIFFFFRSAKKVLLHRSLFLWAGRHLLLKLLHRRTIGGLRL
jgi:hypothetical protein